jgi:hypothetical protein
LSSDEIATVKTWLVATAQRLERANSHEPPTPGRLVWC